MSCFELISFEFMINKFGCVLAEALESSIGCREHRFIILLSLNGKLIGLLFAPVVDFQVATFAHLSGVHLSVLVFAVGRFLDASKPVVAVCTETFWAFSIFCKFIFWVVGLVHMLTAGDFLYVFPTSSFLGRVFLGLLDCFRCRLLLNVVFLLKLNRRIVL